MMTNKKDVIIAVLATFCLVTTLFMMIRTSNTQGSREYDPWLDVNDDGKIDMKDIGYVIQLFGTSGTAINKTALLLELEDRIDALNATLISLEMTKHCAGTEVLVTTGKQITITFPFVFNTPPQLSVVVFVMTGTHAGKVCYIQSMNVGTASATLDLQAWSGAAYQDISDGENVQVSYTAVETP